MRLDFHGLGVGGGCRYQVSLTESRRRECHRAFRRIRQEYVSSQSQAIVIIPTFNERENIEELVEKLLAVTDDVDVLIVDDNSEDGTGELADRLAEKHEGVHVLHRKCKTGLGRAYCDGFSWALKRDYEYFLEMDGDFSHDPREVPNFIKAAQEADLVIGSRYRQGIRVINWPLNRLMLSLCAAKYVQLITGMPFSDPTGGFKCFRRSSFEVIDLEQVRSNGYSFQIEMTHSIWRQGLRVAEIPIVFTDRFHGTSKMSQAIVKEALVVVWQLLLRNGLRRKPVQ